MARWLCIEFTIDLELEHGEDIDIISRWGKLGSVPTKVLLKKRTIPRIQLDEQCAEMIDGIRPGDIFDGELFLAEMRNRISSSIDSLNDRLRTRTLSSGLH